MIETYFARISWAPRRESSQSCAQRAFALLEALERLDPSFRDFWMWSRGRKKVRVPVLANREQAAQIISRNVNRNDWDRKVIETLGFSGEFITAVESEVNLKKGQSVFLRFNCGCFGSTSNSCSMDVPVDPPVADRVLRWEVLAELLRIMLDTMDGDNGLVTSHEHWDLVNDHPITTDKPVGWLMYFSRAQGVVPPLPAPVRIEPVGDKGTLVILTPERLTAANPGHVELGRQVRRLLSKAGLLRDPYRAFRPEPS
ncbi:MAG TPA: Imm52 family immunity protein [Myxococcaceae bacterium]|nr:Imm52 family immunity protein [Myxococcaceae bacterium]